MNTFLQSNNVLLLVISILWVLPWKGYALWTASKKDQKIWFVLMMVLNTFAILEIFYIFYIAKKTPNDIAKLFKTKKKEETK